MRNTLSAIALGFLLLAQPALADAPSAAVPAWHLEKDKSALKFIAIQNNAPVEGQFKDFTADIHFDPGQLEQSAISVEVVIASVEADNADVTANVKQPEWLSAAAFPKAVFKTTGPLHRMPQSDNYYADGALTLRGKTLPVTLNFQLQQPDDKTAIATGYVTVKRGDFGVGEGEWSRYDVIKNEVRIEFRVVAEKQ